MSLSICAGDTVAEFNENKNQQSSLSPLPHEEPHSTVEDIISPTSSRAKRLRTKSTDKDFCSITHAMPF